MQIFIFFLITKVRKLQIFFNNDYSENYKSNGWTYWYQNEDKKIWVVLFKIDEKKINLKMPV